MSDNAPKSQPTPSDGCFGFAAPIIGLVLWVVGYGEFGRKRTQAGKAHRPAKKGGCPLSVLIIVTLLTVTWFAVFAAIDAAGALADAVFPTLK